MIPGLTIASTNPTATSVAATLAAVANPSGSFSVVQMASGTIGDTPGSLPGTLDLTFKNPITKDNTLLMFVAPAFGWTVTPSSGIDVWVPTPTGGTWADLTGHENGATTIDQIFYTLHSAGGETTVSVTIAGEGPSVPIVDVFVFEIASLISFDVVYPLPTDAATWQGSSGQNVNGVLPITTTTAPDVIISWWYSSSIPGTESTLIYASSLDPDANTWFGWMFEYQIANDQGVPGAYTSTAEDVTSGDFGQALASIAFKIAYAPPEPNPLACGNTNLWNMNSDICSATVMPQGIAQQYASLSSLSNPSDPTLQLLMPDPSFFLSLPNFPPLPAFPISIDTSSSSVNMPPGPIDLPLGPNQNLQSYIEGLPGNAALNSTQASTVAGNIGWILGLNIPNNSTASGLFTAMKDALVSDAIGGVSGGIQTLYSLYSTLLSLSPLGSLKGSGLDLNTYLLKGMPTLNLTGISQAMQQSVAQKSSAPIMNFLQSATIIFLPFISEATHTNMAQAFEDMLNAGITNKFYTADLANQMYDAFLGALSALQGFDYQMITEPEQAGTPVLASAQAYSAQMQALIGSVMISLIVPTMNTDGSQGLLTPAQVVTALNALRDAINAARATNMESMIESLEIVAKECGPLE